MIELIFNDKFPVLDLGDIVLRELTEDDAQDYYTYMSRDTMRPYLTDVNRPSTYQEALIEVKYWRSIFYNKRSIYWAVILKETNKLVGTAGFNAIFFNHLRAEISYDLDSDYWGKGIMLKSVKNILKFADLNLSLMRVQATVITDNMSSIKLLERCGFLQEGILKKYEIVENQHKDYYMYARVN